MNTQVRSLMRYWQRASKLIAFLSIAYTSLVFSDELKGPLIVSSQHSFQASYRDLSKAIVLKRFTPLSFLELELGGATAFSMKDWESVTYKIEALTKALPFLEFRVRASHHFLLPLSISTSHLLYIAQLKTPPVLGVHFFTSFGWFQRFMQLNKAVIFFFPPRNSYSEHDFALELGLHIDLGNEYYTRVRAATFDEMDVYNLNHPMGELSVGIPLQENLFLTAFTRYQVVLGFGRMDNLTFGLNFSLL